MADMKLAFLFLFIMVTATSVKPQYCPLWKPIVGSWHNNWKHSFRAWCSGGYSLSHWYSYYRNCQGDRLYHIRCLRTPAYGHRPSCVWTQYLNGFGQYFFQTCANNAYITGIYSDYDQNTSDRRFKLLCCSVQGYHMTNCITTPYQNFLGQSSLFYEVPAGYTLTGVGSNYSSTYEDRQWRFRVCKMQ